METINLICACESKIFEIIFSKTCIFTYVHNSQDLYSVYVSMNERMDKENGSSR
jgi:hypothetical protein